MVQNADVTGYSAASSSDATPLHIPPRSSSCGQLFQILLELPVPPWVKLWVTPLVVQACLVAMPFARFGLAYVQFLHVLILDVYDYTPVLLFVTSYSDNYVSNI